MKTVRELEDEIKTHLAPSPYESRYYPIEKYKNDLLKTILQYGQAQYETGYRDAYGEKEFISYGKKEDFY